MRKWRLAIPFIVLFALADWKLDNGIALAGKALIERSRSQPFIVINGVDAVGYVYPADRVAAYRVADPVAVGCSGRRKAG